MNAKRAVESWCLFLLAFLVCPCTPSSCAQQTGDKGTPIDVRALLKTPSQYADRVVVVKGCYVQHFEVVVLQPCDGKFNHVKDSIWLYNDGKSAFGRLGYTGKHPLEVVLKGDFKTGGKYGQLGAYPNSLLVHELVSHEAPPDEP